MYIILDANAAWKSITKLLQNIFVQTTERHGALNHRRDWSRKVNLFVAKLVAKSNFIQKPGPNFDVFMGHPGREIKINLNLNLESPLV